MLVRVKVQNKTYHLGGMWGVRIVVKVVRWDDESKATWALYSSDGDEKLMIYVSMVVIELKGGVCAVFNIRG